MPRTHFTYAQQVCIKRSGLALQRAGTLHPGARIGIALSGGVDSFILLKTLQIRQRILPFPISLLPIHLNPGFNVTDHAHLGAWLANEGLPGHMEITDYGPRAHSPENLRNSPCFYCAWLRRKHLFELCKQYRLTHLAIGHNCEDMAHTYLMNILRNGRAEGLHISEPFFKGKLQMIRPLLLIEKKYIRQAARQWNLPVWKNACPSSGHTSRTEMEMLLKTISNTIPTAQKSLLSALSRQELARYDTPAVNKKNGHINQPAN